MQGLNEINSKINDIANNGLVRDSDFHTIGNKILRDIKDAFVDEKSPFNKPWAPLKPRYLKQKLKQGKSGRILVRDNNLASRWEVVIGKLSVVVSNNITSINGFHYGLSHQFGAPNINIPARPFMPVKDGELEPNLKNEIAQYLEKTIKDRLDK